MTCCRGVRGAVVAAENTTDAILKATRELLKALLAANPIQTEDIAAIYFSAAADLNAAYPAAAARQMGLTSVPLFCVQEMAVAGSLPRCIRILLLWNTNLAQDQIHPVYLGEARQLRPDLTTDQGE
jgi:chorismate mutase